MGCRKYKVVMEGCCDKGIHHQNSLSSYYLCDVETGAVPKKLPELWTED